MQYQYMIYGEVFGREGAEAFPLTGANMTAMLMDKTRDRFYWKQTDSAGVPHLKACDFEEAEEEAAAPADYVTREEFAELNGKVDRLLKELGDG